MAKGRSKHRGVQKSGRQAIRDWPVSERPSEKLLHLGTEGLSDGELLAVLLRIGKAGQSAEDLARQLMSMFNGISGIKLAHLGALLAVPDMDTLPKWRNCKLPLKLGEETVGKRGKS